MRFKAHILVLLLVLLFTTCKKYPENTLWFRNPEKVFKGGRLQYLKVNNVDSLPFFNSYYGFNINSEIIDYDNKTDYLASFHFVGNMTILKKSDKVGLYLHLTSAPQNNNKVTDFSIYNFCEWQILKYTKTGELKLKTEKNGKTYEVLFEYQYFLMKNTLPKSINTKTPRRNCKNYFSRSTQ